MARVGLGLADGVAGWDWHAPEMGAGAQLRSDRAGLFDVIPARVPPGWASGRFLVVFAWNPV
ncbi:hypothetical protein Bpla01_11540 [Burkholderia plantarii]|nr:hypothetical protein Bpla01_11540 [Burkholderia plantarii]